jgi:hypothetical protein
MGAARDRAELLSGMGEGAPLLGVQVRAEPLRAAAGRCPQRGCRSVAGVASSAAVASLYLRRA